MNKERELEKRVEALEEQNRLLILSIRSLIVATQYHLGWGNRGFENASARLMRDLHTIPELVVRKLKGEESGEGNGEGGGNGQGD